MSAVTTSRPTALPVWLIVTIAGFAALFYAFAVWTAVGFLVQQSGGAAGLTGYGWFVLLLPVVFPLAVFAGAFALGWRRRALPFVLLLACGLCLVAALWLNVFAYASVTPGLYNG